MKTASPHPTGTLAHIDLRLTLHMRGSRVCIVSLDPWDWRTASSETLSLVASAAGKELRARGVSPPALTPTPHPKEARTLILHD